MSLKYFHAVLIFLSIILCVGFGIFALKLYVAQSSGTYLALGMLSLLVGVSLMGYGIWYLGEIKKL